ncbi:MAG TPA: hypothetical protein VIO11_07595 [Candidatus Methanoperedens sp.]
MRLSKMMIGIGMILILLALFFYFIPLFISNAEPSSTTASISISSKAEKATVYSPVLLDENGKVLEMFEKPEITGIAATSIIDTEHGKAMKISGSKAIIINTKQKGELLLFNQQANEEFVNKFTISTSNATSYGIVRGPVNAWVYSDEDDIVFSFFISRNNGWGRDMRISNQRGENLTKGWQLIELSVTSLWYD